MATAKRTAADLAEKTMKGAAEIADQKKSGGKDAKRRKPQSGTIVSVRIDPVDKEALLETFENSGVTLSGGIKLASLYVLQEINSGRLRITKAGLFPRR
jgi:hypothetical protein